MDASRQILRYSIPGGVLLLLVGLCAGVSQFTQVVLTDRGPHGERDTASLSVAREALAGLPDISVEMLVGAIAASIPIGFILYQLYHSLLTLNFLNIVRVDRGQDVLGQLWEEGRLKSYAQRSGWEFMPTQHMLRRFPPRRSVMVVWRLHRGTRAKRLEYRHRLANNLHGLKGLIDEGCGTAIGRELKKEYTNLSDIFHALGASRMAVVVTIMAYTVHQVLSAAILGREWFLATANVVLVMLIAVGIWAAFTIARGQTWGTLSHILQSGLRIRYAPCGE